MGCVVGIDPSLTSTGICVITNGEIGALHSVKSGPTKAGIRDRAIRIRGLANEVTRILADTYLNHQGIDLLVIEGPSHNSRFGKPHERGGLWWQIINGTDLYVDEYVEVAPQSRAKYGTGNGGSKKPVVLKAVREDYGPLAPRPIKNSDEGDAVLLAAMGARVLGVPLEGESPGEANLESLRGICEQLGVDYGTRELG